MWYKASKILLEDQFLRHGCHLLMLRPTREGPSYHHFENVNTDSIYVQIFCKDAYSDVKQSFGNILDLSNYPPDHFMYDNTNHAKLGKLKSETILPIKEIIALKLKILVPQSMENGAFISNRSYCSMETYATYVHRSPKSAPIRDLDKGSSSFLFQSSATQFVLLQDSCVLSRTKWDRVFGVAWLSPNGFRD
ncbi:hypothetical protein JTE90_021259 [Oedothorax gibbosus]|uniref:Uncharacterized protein n=1 Tax=Oedothorax gibbosus TaxID=931172 RepID=A0AAV6TMY1_9ARAC|nr:hypothetical protein JTE90_021259 [Oedothorax gibbosus]